MKFFPLTFQKRKKQTLGGFTLVELIVAVGIFSTVMLLAIGALLSIVSANHEAQAMKSVMNNLNSALENMSRNIRTGYDFVCDNSESGSCPGPVQSITFTSSKGRTVTYQLTGTSISKADGGGVSIPITATEVKVNRLDFYIYGTSGDTSYPRVFMIVGGEANVAGKQSLFNVETMMAQRTII